MKHALRLVVTACALGLVLWVAGPQDVAQTLRAVDPGWLVLAVLALAAQIALSALRWRVTAQALGHDLPPLWAVREYGLSVAINTFLPGGILGDVGRILRSRGLGWKGAAASVILERLSGQVALGMVAVMALSLWWGTWLGWALPVAMVAGGAVLLFALPTLRQLLGQVWLAAGIWPSQLALTLVILIANLAGFWCAARAVGVLLALPDALLVLSLTLLAMLVPLTVNGWGLREGAAAALWPMVGITAPQAVAGSVAFGLACMGAALLGLIPWLARADRGDTPAAP
jgi:glycosyltransferase 2 family protein